MTLTLYKDQPAAYGGHQLAASAIAYQQTFTPSSWSASNTGNDSWLVVVDPTGMNMAAHTTYDLVVSNKDNTPVLLATYDSAAGGPSDSFSVNLAWGGWFGGTNGLDLAISLDPPSLGSPGAPVSAAVPEPSTWALMILGFGGLAAFSSRSRRSRAKLVIA